jgi:NitT/TauT family transport system ATP-binding protein
MVFQKYSLYPWLTAAQNVAFGMELQGRTREEIRERTSYFLEVVGLADAARRLPRELSGGMQQRVAIARALAAEPKVLLLDEPFGALDIQIRESMQEFLHQLWRQTGLTALLITHDLEEALLLANRVHILAPSPGRIVRTVASSTPLASSTPWISAPTAGVMRSMRKSFAVPISYPLPSRRFRESWYAEQSLGSAASPH